MKAHATSRKRALSESALGVVVLAAAGAILRPGDPAFLSASPDPYLLLVLFMGTLHGWVGGVASAVLSAVAVLLAGSQAPGLETALAGGAVWARLATLGFVGYGVGVLQRHQRNRLTDLEEAQRDAEERRLGVEARYEVLRQAKQELERRLIGIPSSLERVYELVRALEQMHPDDVRKGLLRVTAMLLGADRCSWWELEDEGQQLRLIESHGWRLPQAVVRVPADSGLMGLGLTQRRVVAFTELPEQFGVAPLPEWPEIQTLLCVPIQAHGSCVAVVNVESIPFERLTRSGMRTLGMIADLGASALEYALLFQQAEAERPSDRVSGLLRPEYLLKRLEEERARSERYHLPFSLVGLAWSGWQDFLGLPEERRQAFLKAIASSLRAQIRVVDLAGSSAVPGQFIVAMPLTDLPGAKVTLSRVQPLLQSVTEQSGMGGRWTSAVGGIAKGEPVARCLERIQTALETMDHRRSAGSVTVVREPE